MSRRRLVGFLILLCFWRPAARAQGIPLTIANESFPNGVLGQQYLQALRYSGGCQSDLTPKPQFSVSAGSLPAGLAIEVPSNAGSVLTGVPAAVGTFRFTLKVSDTCGNSASKTFAITVNKDAAQQDTLPQFVFGGGWYSALYFTNMGPSAVSFPVSFSGDDGRPLTVPSVGGSSATVSLTAHGTAVIEAPDAGPLTQGYASVSLPDGVAGYGVFRSNVTGQGDREAVVPFSAPSANSTLIWDDTKFVTAAAVVNLGSGNDTLTIVVRDSQGTVIGTAAVPMAAGSKVAMVLRGVNGLSAMAGNRGSAEFSMTSGILAVLGLRFNGPAMTSIPTADR